VAWQANAKAADGAHGIIKGNMHTVRLRFRTKGPVIDVLPRSLSGHNNKRKTGPAPN
jgi:hypothetical protein